MPRLAIVSPLKFMKLSRKMLVKQIRLIGFNCGYSNHKSFVNFLLPPQGIGEGWGGVKILRLI